MHSKKNRFIFHDTTFWYTNFKMSSSKRKMCIPSLKKENQRMKRVFKPLQNATLSLSAICKYSVKLERLKN